MMPPSSNPPPSLLFPPLPPSLLPPLCPLSLSLCSPSFSTSLTPSLMPPLPSVPSLLCSPPTAGLKEAQNKANDYKPLPVNDLLAANTLESIMLAVSAIYNHLRKIHTTSYPPQRAIYLVEAISRDLSSQLLKVRSLHSLVCLDHKQFSAEK